MFEIEFEHDCKGGSSELLALDVYLGRNRRQTEVKLFYWSEVFVSCWRYWVVLSPVVCLKTALKVLFEEKPAVIAKSNILAVCCCANISRT